MSDYFFHWLQPDIVRDLVLYTEWEISKMTEGGWIMAETSATH